MLRHRGTLCRDKLVWLAGGPGFPGCSVAEADGSPPADTLLNLAIVTGTLAARAIKGCHKVTKTPSLAAPYTHASRRRPIILSIWPLSVDRHEITSRAFFDNCRYSHKDGQPY